MKPAIGNRAAGRRACRNKPFGTAGHVATPSLSGYSMAIAPDDKIVVAGRFYPTGASTDLRTQAALDGATRPRVVGTLAQPCIVCTED